MDREELRRFLERERWRAVWAIMREVELSVPRGTEEHKAIRHEVMNQTELFASRVESYLCDGDVEHPA